MTSIAQRALMHLINTTDHLYHPSLGHHILTTHPASALVLCGNIELGIPHRTKKLGKSHFDSTFQLPACLAGPIDL